MQGQLLVQYLDHLGHAPAGLGLGLVFDFRAAERTPSFKHPPGRSGLGPWCCCPSYEKATGFRSWEWGVVVSSDSGFESIGRCWASQVFREGFPRPFHVSSRNSNNILPCGLCRPMSSSHHCHHLHYVRCTMLQLQRFFAWFSVQSPKPDAGGLKPDAIACRASLSSCKAFTTLTCGVEGVSF